MKAYEILTFSAAAQLRTLRLGEFRYGLVRSTFLMNLKMSLPVVRINMLS